MSTILPIRCLLAVALAVALAVQGCAGGPGSPSPSGSASVSQVLIYLVGDASVSCAATHAVERSVVEATPESGLRALLAGPTDAERAAGYSSWFSAATADMLESVTVADGVARVSFGDLRTVIPNASSSCGSEALLTALDSTLRQFPEVRSARYSILGDETAFYEWLQMEPPAGSPAASCGHCGPRPSASVEPSPTAESG